MDHSAQLAGMLWDIEQIKQLKARYFRFLDAKDWAAFAELFTEDCEHVIPDGSGRTISNAQYLSGVQKQLDGCVSTHIGHMPEITILSETEATGTWSMFDFLQWSSGREVRGYGHYHETYRKGPDGRWRISSKRNVRQRMERGG